ncbi:SDR family oxidoreductase [Variovorax defluvii]|uniref:SDR family oxidoreductase n=1 Tax=Variovorax defluvii TaxID=913761 RepID=A0ABP8I988_9BURK
MDLGISGKRAVVIGGSQGLGLAVCERLAAEGVNLLLFARDSKKLDEACGQLRSAHGVQVDACAGDITRAEDIDRVAAQAAGNGGVHILVLNTPRPPSPMRDFLQENEDARWEQAYQQQLHGALLVLRKLVPLVAESGWGRVVAITSASIKQPMPRHALSTIFRAGVQAALKHLAMELAPRGVTVNAVAPATVITPTFSTFHNLEARIQSVPMKRVGQPEELSATVAFLASAHAGFITGETIQLDGGQTLALC